MTRWACVAIFVGLLTLCGVQSVRLANAERDYADYRARIAADAQKTEAAYRAIEKAKQQKTEEVINAQISKQQATVARAARLDATVVSLRNQIAELNRRAVPTDASAAEYAGQAATARELLGQCAARYTSVATAADGLKDQVSGLLNFYAVIAESKN